MTPHPRCSLSAARGASALVLAALLTASLDAGTQAAPPRICPPPSIPTGALQPKKEPDKKEPDKKEPDAKLPEIKWPTDINGKDIVAVMKDMEAPDPTIREFAARTLPLFGPPAQKENASKLLLKRMRTETDPGVRVAVYGAVSQLQFEKEADNVEALRILADVVDAPIGPNAALYRLHAIQAISAFGPKGEAAITKLTGVAMSDPSYETRRNIATALGRVGFNEKTGPNMKALTALADRLARDESASVRMEALQSLMILGPPWAEVRKPDDKLPPKIETKSAEVIIGYMKVRVGDPKTKKVGLEKDKQVEIWARLVLMRFDPREVNDDNLDAFARYLTGAEAAVKVQALNAIGILGEMASKKLSDVIRVMEEQNAPLQQIIACGQVLMAMGAGAKPAIPNLRKMIDEKKKEAATKKDDEKKTLEELIKFLEKVIKHIDEAKPMSPAGAPPEPPKKP